MKLRLNISTCPNDTFMFDALINKRIDTEGLSFELNLCDIEQLNSAVLAAVGGGGKDLEAIREAVVDRPVIEADGAEDADRAAEEAERSANREREERIVALSNVARVSGEVVHMSKISYALYPQIKEKYLILNSGSALGRGNSPLLVSRHRIYPDELHDAVVAIPGAHTTANLLLSRLFPKIKDKREYLFSDVAEVVMSNECDAGVLIHEGRFTYAAKGLKLIADLGVEWEKSSGLPLPLGAIVVSRDLEPQIQKKIDRLLKKSVEYALANPKTSAAFVKQYAQEMNEEVTAQHIELFVNQHSVDLGEEGRRAVRTLLNIKNEEIFV